MNLCCIVTGTMLRISSSVAEFHLLTTCLILSVYVCVMFVAGYVRFGAIYASFVNVFVRFFTVLFTCVYSVYGEICHDLCEGCVTNLSSMLTNNLLFQLLIYFQKSMP